MTSVVDVSKSLPAGERAGDWGLTFTGRQFWPRDPRPSDICIDDVAHALSMACRFGGHCRRFYSVAQHSILVSETCAPEHALQGLLHDATEAYLGDVIRPLKREMDGYRILEARWAAAIGSAFGLELEHLPPDIKRADMIVLSTEHRDLMSAGGPSWVTDAYVALPLAITPWPPELAEQRFLDRFRLLTGEAAP